MKVKGILIKPVNLLWNAVWHSLIYGTLWYLLIGIFISAVTSGIMGLIFFVPIGCVEAVSFALPNALLLFIVGLGLFYLPNNKTLHKFLFIILAVVLELKFGGAIVFYLVKDDKMLGGMANELAQASSAIVAVSYGITNYQFACWYDRYMMK